MSIDSLKRCHHFIFRSCATSSDISCVQHLRANDDMPSTMKLKHWSFRSSIAVVVPIRNSEIPMIHDFYEYVNCWLLLEWKKKKNWRTTRKNNGRQNKKRGRRKNNPKSFPKRLNIDDQRSRTLQFVWLYIKDASLHQKETGQDAVPMWQVEWSELILIQAAEIPCKRNQILGSLNQNRNFHETKQTNIQQ